MRPPTVPTSAPADAALTAERAAALRTLHHRPAPLVPADVWDAPSAVLVAVEGAAALATTSGGVAWVHGRPDGHELDLSRVVAAAGGAR